MKRARDVPEAIQWHEGMMLAPQHFQQLTLRQEELLGYHMPPPRPTIGGSGASSTIRRCSPTGVFRVLELEAVMPDGLLVAHGPDCDPLDLVLAPLAEAMSTGAVTLHLAVARRRSGGGDPDDGLQRYRDVAGPPVADEVSAAAEVPITRLRPRLQLLPVRPGEPPPDPRYVAFPLAGVTRRNETFALTEYQPPALALTRDSAIGAQCVKLSKTIREKAVGLAERVNSPALPSGSDRLRYMQALLRSLLPGLPPFEAVLNSAAPHPFAVYLALTGLMGQIASLGSDTVPPLLDPYDHNDLHRSFRPAFDFLLRMLDRVQETYTAHPFLYENGRYALLLEPAFLAETLTIGVRTPAAGREADIAAWVEDCLIGSGGSLDDLWSRRILGARRRRIESDPAIGLVPPRGMVLFSLTVDPEIIQPHQPLVIWNVGEDREGKRPPEILLYVGIPAAAPAGAGGAAPRGAP